MEVYDYSVCTYLSNGIIRAILIFKNHCGFNTKATLGPFRKWMLWATSLQTTDRNYDSESSLPATDQNSTVARCDGNVCQAMGNVEEVRENILETQAGSLSLRLYTYFLSVPTAEHLNTSDKLASRRVPGRCSVNIS